MYSKDALSVQLFVVNGTQSLFKQSLFLLKSASLVLSVLCRGIFFSLVKKVGSGKRNDLLFQCQDHKNELDQEYVRSLQL